jgi:hypothetical protein
MASETISVLQKLYDMAGLLKRDIQASEILHGTLR